LLAAIWRENILIKLALYIILNSLKQIGETVTGEKCPSKAN
jgi:hypothetical protein